MSRMINTQNTCFILATTETQLCVCAVLVHRHLSSDVEVGVWVVFVCILLYKNVKCIAVEEFSIAYRQTYSCLRKC